MIGERKQAAGARRQAAERRVAGIDERAQEFGGGGFSGGGWTSEDQDGIRSGGLQRGQQPGEDGGDRGGREVEEMGEVRGQRFRGSGGWLSALGRRKRMSVAAGAKMEIADGSYGPALRRDFDDFTVGVLEVENELVRSGCEAMMEFGRLAELSASFEDADGVTERVSGGRRAVIATTVFDDPVLE